MATIYATNMISRLSNAAGNSGVGVHIAVTHFREMLEEFARVGRPPKAWRRLLPPVAPFFKYTGDHEMQVVSVPLAA